MNGSLRTCTVGCLTLLGLGIALLVAWDASLAKERAEVLSLIRGAEPLCSAIEAYAEERGESPTSLDLLVPDFIADLPPLRSEADGGFRYKGGGTADWRLSFWLGGAFGTEYARTSTSEPWYIVGDYDEDYPREQWIPIR